MPQRCARPPGGATDRGTAGPQSPGAPAPNAIVLGPRGPSRLRLRSGHPGSVGVRAPWASNFCGRRGLTPSPRRVPSVSAAPAWPMEFCVPVLWPPDVCDFPVRDWQGQHGSPLPLYKVILLARRSPVSTEPLTLGVFVVPSEAISFQHQSHESQDVWYEKAFYYRVSKCAVSLVYLPSLLGT
ncbi:Nuclease Exog [Manis pentadactyla]|nr:Nuclease Exog [Manis pentadactyla]